MINIRKHIPNFITCLNLFSGCIACVMAFEGNYMYAAIAIYIAAVFDFFDGFAARLLKAYSPLGKELDSLADCISFGLAPGLIMFSVFKDVSFPFIPMPYLDYVPYIAFIIPVFSALRLAKFNIDERQTSSFIGLPTPANTLFIASLAANLPYFFIKNGIYLVLLVVVLSYLLVAELPMFSLKIKSLKWKENMLQFSILIIGVLILSLLGFGYLYLIIIIYILMSAIATLVCKKEKVK